MDEWEGKGGRDDGKRAGQWVGKAGNRNDTKGLLTTTGHKVGRIRFVDGLDHKWSFGLSRLFYEGPFHAVAHNNSFRARNQ